MQPYKTTTTLLLLLSLCNHAFASLATDEEFALCRPFANIAPPRPQLPPPEGKGVRLFADAAVVQQEQAISTFQGNVLLQRGEQILKAPLLVYDYDKDTANANKDFTFWDPKFIISGTHLKSLPDNQGEMSDATYWLLTKRARGYSDKIIKESEEVMTLEHASYTTCDPKKEIWRLDARSITLDNAEEMGTAYHVTLNILDVPVFYTPYLSFPLGNGRESGFLTPNVGSSDETGLEFSLPYYLNLAPNYDATITPRYMTRRGLLVTSEFRYLTERTGGKVEAEYLPYDTALGRDRASLALTHRGQLAEHWFTDINYNYASDNRYFAELGNNISVASISHLERREDLLYVGTGWDLLGRLQGFQSLDKNPATRPYQRLPQLLFNTRLPETNRHFNPQVQAEAVRFERDTNVVKAPIGDRFDLKASLNYPWRTPGLFVVPKLSLRYTFYNLSQVTTPQETQPDRLLFTFSTDSGLVFDREVSFLDTDLLQTLEPRLFYRYTPYRNQKELPIFDTAKYDISFGQLFRENNFSGADRVDDGHQITLALTSRLLGSATGMEHLRTSVGQTYYLRDRQVTLPGQPTESDSYSPLIVEMAAQPVTHWTNAATIIWDPGTGHTQQTVLRTRYRPDDERVVNLSYRLRQQTLEQTDVSWHWPLGVHWKMLGRWNYSLPNQTTLETFGGLEYESCCWAIRGIARRFLNDVTSDNYLNGFFLQLQLKGLGGIGSKRADSFLEQSIPGYHNQF